METTGTRGQPAAAPPTVTRADWSGLLAGQRPVAADTRLRATLRQSTAGGSGSFLGLAENGNRYWIKPLNNWQGPRVPATEQIVGRVGRLINAPTCEVCTIEITNDFVGWEFRPGKPLEAGVAHASLHVEDVIETRPLTHHAEDDNARRHAYLLAVYDWCWGGDLQGLLAVRQENRFYSHDHGWYLPPTGRNWTITDLEASVDVPHESTLTAHQITPSVAESLAVVLEGINRQALKGALTGIPASWPVSDDELECVGYFLEKRVAGVASRIRTRYR